MSMSDSSVSPAGNSLSPAINGINEHFQMNGDEPRRRNRRDDGGPPSPSHSAQGAFCRATLQKIQKDKKARKVRFYRNGDRYFKGVTLAVSLEKYRSFEALLADLTRMLSDSVNLSQGVRQVYTCDGMYRITNIEDIDEGEAYVAASNEPFRQLDYHRNNSPSWNSNVKMQHKDKHGSIYGKSGAAMRQQRRAVELAQSNDDLKDFIRPRLVTIIRNGVKPRKAIRILLNKKTAHSYEQVLRDITDAIKLDTGAVRRIYTLDGKVVSSLPDFFKDDDVFIAYGPEKYSCDDFELDNRELKYVANSKSPAATRRALTSYAS